MTGKVETVSGNNNLYAVVADRGVESLALSLVYEKAMALLDQEKPPLPGNLCSVAILVARFVALSPKAHPGKADEAFGFEPFENFQPRALGEFTNAEGQKVFGARLNRVAIPVFVPAPTLGQFVQMCEKFVVFDVLSDWVRERVQEGGFKMRDVVLPSLLKGLVVGDIGEYEDSQYKFILGNLPSFAQQGE